MEDPKILLGRICVIFDIMCFLLALYMTLKNIGRFHEDANATAIAYKKYGHTIADKYPSFSICFQGQGFYRFNESAIFAAYGIHLEDYQMILDGEKAFRYQYDATNKRYNKALLPLSFKPSIGFDKEDLFQLPDIIEKTIFAAEFQRQTTVFDKTGPISVGQVVEEQPFFVSYQSLTLFCLTRKQTYSNQLIMRIF